MKKKTLCFTGLVFCFMFQCLWLFSQNSTEARPYGEQNLIEDFLCSEVVYPENELKQGIEGKVVISFTIDKDGSVSKVQVREKVNPDLDREAVRLFRMILWEPATSFGQPVESTREFPISFNIKKYNKHCKTRGYITSSYPYTPVDTSLQVYEYSQADKKPYPIFEEKDMKLGMFIAKNIRYPETAYRQNLSGKVSLKFVVEPTGRVSNIRVINPVGGGCTQEAIRLLGMIKWMPAIENQKAVRSFMNLDIEFKLPEDSDMNIFENSQMNSN